MWILELIDANGNHTLQKEYKYVSDSKIRQHLSNDVRCMPKDLIISLSKVTSQISYSVTVLYALIVVWTNTYHVTETCQDNSEVNQNLT